MYDFEIFADSAGDLNDEQIKKYNINIVPFYVTFDGVNYVKEREELQLDEFYKILCSEKVFPKTSLPSIQDYADKFRPVLENGKDVLCICLTSKFSGSIESARNAKDMLHEEFPERTILITDSLTASLCEGQIIMTAAKLREAGKPIETVYDLIYKMNEVTKVYVTVDTLEYLQKGGRIGKVSAFAGNLFDIKPIIVLEEGELIPIHKVRGRKKAISKMIEIVNNIVKDQKSAYDIGIVYSACYDEALKLEETLKTQCGITVGYGIVELGTTIGSHIGPYVLGISYCKKII